MWNVKSMAWDPKSPLRCADYLLMLCFFYITIGGSDQYISSYSIWVHFTSCWTLPRRWWTRTMSKNIKPCANCASAQIKVIIIACVVLRLRARWQHNLTSVIPGNRIELTCVRNVAETVSRSALLICREKMLLSGGRHIDEFSGISDCLDWQSLQCVSLILLGETSSKQSRH